MIRNIVRKFSTLVPKRRDFAKLLPKHVKFFKTILNDGEIKENDIDNYNSDWYQIYKGNSKLVLQPRTTKSISKILKYCNKQNLAVCPQSGNTGLVGGSNPIHDEIILSLRKMNKIIGYDKQTQVISAESGVILENMQDFLEKFNMEAPFDLGAKGSCCIGGNVATHAGGIHLIQHGPLRAYVLGLEAVLPNGKILDMMQKNRKDNTGFDLKQLLVGSEGILGVITKVNMLCVQKEKNKTVVFLKVPDYGQVLKVEKIAKSLLGKNLSALEFMDSKTYNLVQQHVPSANDPFKGKQTTKSPFYVLVELSSNGSLDELFMELIETIEKKINYNACIFADSEKNMKNLWHVREAAAIGLGKEGYNFPYDVSLKSKEWKMLVDYIGKIVGNLGQVCSFGHIGDGNVHINVICDEKRKKKVERLIEPAIFKWLHPRKGSISSEHGIGFFKADYLHYSKNLQAIESMKQIKKVFDPKGILNPYKVIGQSYY